jgi:DNA-binding NarL/FixJ family response regulator
MAKDSSNNGIVKVGNYAIVRYSNALVKRALEELQTRSQSVVSPSMKKRILLGADKNEHIDIVFAELFNEQNFEVDVVEYYNERDLQPIMSQMLNNHYDVVVATNLGVSGHCLPQFVSQIKQAHPTTRILVVSGYDNPDFVLDLTRRGIDEFFPVVREKGELLRRIKQLLRM